MKTIEERIEILEEKMVIMERRAEASVNPYKSDSTKENGRNL